MTLEEAQAKILADFEEVVGKEVLVESLTGYKDDDMVELYDLNPPEAQAHRAALRVAIHETLLKEAELGLITFTERSVNWVPSPEDIVSPT